MYKSFADKTLDHLAAASRNLKKAKQQCLYGDDGTGCDYATQSEIEEIERLLMAVQVKVLMDVKGE